MDERVRKALSRARALTKTHRVEKTIWGSPAGKKRLAARLVKMLPSHKTYVEPFAGSAAVLFAKEPSEVEVIGDADAEIAQAFRLIKKLTPAKLERLKAMKWTGDEATFKRLYDALPQGELEKLHRFLYVTHFSYGKLRKKSFNPGAQGVEAKTVGRLEQHAPRLKGVKIHSGDYEPLIRKYDSPNTVFFLDPPYAGYDVDVGEAGFDEERFFKVLQSIKGKWLLTYGVRGKLPKLLKGAGYNIKRIRTPRGIRSMRGVGGPKTLTQLVVTNFKAETKKGAPFDKSITLIKGLNDEDERYVLGIVLEPDVVDAQSDTYSAEEVRQAAHRFMEDFGSIGVMHRMSADGQVKILETFLAPADFSLADVSVRKGTWMLAVRVLSDGLWEKIQAGDLTGFSIGGSARRVPEQSEEQTGVAHESEAAA